MDTGPAYRAMCLFTSQRRSWYQIILLGDRGTCVWTTCLRSLPGSVLVRSRTCACELPQDYKSDTLPLDYRATLFGLVTSNRVVCVYRVREKSDGSFVVSLCDGGAAWHYSIDARATDYGDKLRIENGPAFDNLMDVRTHSHYRRCLGYICDHIITTILKQVLFVFSFVSVSSHV